MTGISTDKGMFKTFIPRLLTLCWLTASWTALAQTVIPADLPREAMTMPLDELVPLTPAVVTGRFDNGLSYFIRENREPANRVELRLVVDTGSIMEDDSQLGLAHFLEHMAFNGTENFEKHEIIEFMESIGMRFGGDLNASTSFDETIYKLTVPTSSSEDLATAFNILRDWATALTLDEEEIDKERGVVIEEWRGNQGANMRVTERLISKVVEGSRYADRLPIGTLESLQSFSPDDLRRFYNDWYRPDLMAVIVVGDIDASEVAGMINERFASIPEAVNPRVRTNFEVPLESGTDYLIVTDPEVPISQINVFHKISADYDWTAGGYRQSLVENLYNGMLGARFQEISREPDAPFLQAGSSSSNLVRAMRPYVLSAAVQEAGVEEGLEGLLTEAERVVRFGFTPQELDRQKVALARAVQQYYDNRGSRNSPSMVDELTRAFLTGESVPGEPMEYALTLRFLNEITLEEVNAVGRNWIDDADRMIFVVAPEKAGLAVPDEETLNQVIASIPELDITPYAETTSDAPLLAEIPEGSAVTAARDLGENITEWTLGNGLKVVLKPTDFSDDQVLFSAFSPGGTSLIADSEYASADNAVSMIAGGGLGEFNAIDLQRKLTGKVATVMPVISDYEEGLSGRASPSDLETLFQLIYLRMTDPRADQDYFQVLKNQISTVLQNRSVDPNTAFSDALSLAMYDNHPRKQPPTVGLIDQLDLETALAFYEDRLSDATDFTFVFVGKFDPEAIKPLVETYIGGLPVSGKDEDWRDVGIRLADGVNEQTVRKGLEPQSRSSFVFTGDFDPSNRRERILLNAATEVLQSRLLNVMREELGGTYGVSVRPQVSRLPVGSYSISMNFSSSPERVDELVDAMFDEIHRLQEEGPNASEVADKRLAMLKQHETQLEQNRYWMGQIGNAYREGEPVLESIESFPGDVEAITVEEVQRVMQEYFDEENYIRVTLLPEAA